MNSTFCRFQNPETANVPPGWYHGRRFPPNFSIHTTAMSRFIAAPRRLSLTCLALVISTIAFAQSTTPLPLPTDGRPPARINDVPQTPAPSVSPALRAQTGAALEGWKGVGGGAAFSPGLTYVSGKPALMLVTSNGESESTKLNRKRAIVTACDFLLDAGAFDEATICVVSTDPHGKHAVAAKNTRVTRAQLEQTFVQSGKAANAKDGIKKARTDDALVGEICTALGID